MRVLQRAGDGYALKDVNGPRGIDYAILSHRWYGPGEDILYSDVLVDRKDERVRSKKGWLKLDYGMRHAEKDGYDYLWVDTYCTFCDQRLGPRGSSRTVCVFHPTF